MRWIGVEPRLLATSLRRESVADFRMVFRREIVRRLRRDRSSLNLGVATATGASLSYGENWQTIKWEQVYRNVRRLQTRIVKAVKAVGSHRVHPDGRGVQRGLSRVP